MAECEDLNLYTYRVALPASGYFTVTFSCNGEVFVSDSFNSVDTALAWAESILGEFGTWELDGNTLLLTDSICGVGLLFMNVVGAPEGLSLLLNSSSPLDIEDILGASFVDVSTSDERSTDADWISEFSSANFLFADPFADPTAQWYHIKNSGDGYNILSAEAAARGKTLATVLNGVGNRTYGYDFIMDDMLAYLPLIGTDEVVLSLNLASPLIQVIGTNPVNVAGIDFTDLYAEIDLFMDAFEAAGITIRRFQLCTEMGIQNQNDIIHSANDYKNVCAPVIVHLRALTSPDIPISADAYEVDDNSEYLANYNATINTLDIDGARQYFQFPATLTTYEENRERVAELTHIIDLFEQQFPGKALIFQQEVIKEGNPIKLKVGEGLIFAEFAMNVLLENLERDNLVTDLTFYNGTRLVAGNNTVYPAMKIIQLLRGIFFNNDGKIAHTIVGEGGDDLLIIPVKVGTESRTYILNPTSQFAQFDSVLLNSVAQSVTVESYYGEPTDSEIGHYTSSGSSVLLYPHSLTKITTV